jgi:hypothetical protein
MPAITDVNWPEDRIFQFIKDCGATEVRVNFCGGSDSGCTDSVIFVNSNGDELFDLLAEVGQSYGQAKLVGEDYASLIESLEKPIYDKYTSFDGDPYVTGQLTWDTSTRLITMTGDETYPVDCAISCDIDYASGEITRDEGEDPY